MHSLQFWIWSGWGLIFAVIYYSLALLHVVVKILFGEKLFSCFNVLFMYIMLLLIFIFSGFIVGVYTLLTGYLMTYGVSWVLIKSIKKIVEYFSPELTGHTTIDNEKYKFNCL